MTWERVTGSNRVIGRAPLRAEKSGASASDVHFGVGYRRTQHFLRGAVPKIKVPRDAGLLDDIEEPRADLDDLFPPETTGNNGSG